VFRWKKTKNNRQILVERYNIRTNRLQYLRQIKEYREEGRPIIYMNETYIHHHHYATQWGKKLFPFENSCTAFPATLVGMLELSPPRAILLLRVGGLSALSTRAVYVAGPSQRSLSRVRVLWYSRTYITVSNFSLPFSSPPTTHRVTVEVFEPV
jgi:hypothetical protein